MNLANKRIVVLVVALLVCAGAVIGLTLWNRMKTRAAPEPSDQLMIAYYASQKIEPRIPIEKNMLQKRLIPLSHYFAGQVTNDALVLGKVSQSTMLPGEPILLGKLADPQTLVGLAFNIPPGKRAVSIRVSDLSGFAGMIQPADHVDVILTYLPAGKTAKQSYTILQNEEILAIDETMKNAAESTDLFKSKSKSGNSGNRGMHIITFALSLEKAQQMILAQQQGELTLVLRSFKDYELSPQESVLPVDISEKIGQAGSPLAQALPPGTRGVSVAFAGPSTVLASLLQPGDFVDVLYTIQDTQAGERTLPLLQNKKIYAINKVNIASAEASKIQAQQSLPQNQAPPLPGSDAANAVAGALAQTGGEQVVLTFALNLAEAQKVTLAQQLGQMTMALRPVGDSLVQKQFATMKNDLSQSQKGSGVEIIRGPQQQSTPVLP